MNTKHPENKILISSYGSDIAVGLQGEPDFVEKQLNRFYNYGAMSKRGGFHEESPSFGYFLSSEDNMIKALATEYFVAFQMDGTSKLFKGKPELMEQATIEEATADYEKFEHENFMMHYSFGTRNVLGVAQNGRADTWEEDMKAAK
jgi:hypothetical protein